MDLLSYKYFQQMLQAQDWLKHPGVIAGSKSGIPSTVRRRLIKKKGACCTDCDSRNNLTIDHRLARCLGGTNHYNNIGVLCRDCNQAKAKQENHLLALLQTKEGRAEILRAWQLKQQAGRNTQVDKKARRIAQRELAYQILHGKVAQPHA